MHMYCFKAVLPLLENKGNPLAYVQEYPGPRLGLKQAHPLAQVTAAAQIPGFMNFIKHITR